jgi:poly-gamma-glutamate synthesis protein (capsule biosynthesis protein)
MIGDSFHMLGIGVGKSISSHGTTHIFQEVSSILGTADINIGNLECTFSADKLNPENNLKPYLAYSSENVNCLKYAGFHILNMANNHTMQYGADVFNYTENLLIKNDIKTIGTASNPYQIVTKDAISIAILGYSLRPNQFQHKNIQYIEGDKKKILGDVEVLAKDNDHVIVSIHWGDEYVDYPSRDQVELAHAIVDAGATLIIGHHPHILQGREYYRNAAIYYSLGNFTFDKPQKLQRQSIILQAAFSKDKLETVNLTPIYINNYFQPEIAKGLQKKAIGELLENLNSKIAKKNFSEREYKRSIINGTKSMRFEFYIFFLLNFYKYNPRILLILILGVIKRRLQCKVRK